MNSFVQRYHLVVFAFFLISLFVKLLYVNKFSYWLDEAYTVWFAQQSFHDLWFWVPTFESHPPFYYTLIKAWSIAFNDSTGSTYRYFSMLLSVSFIFLSYKAVYDISVKLNLDYQKTITFNSMLVCFSSILYWYSIEARPYSLLLFSFMVALYGAVRIILSGDQRTLKGWVLYSLGAILTCWSHNLGCIFALFLFISLLYHWGWELKFSRGFFNYLFASNLVVLLFTFPLTIMLLQQASQWQGSSWIREPSVRSFAYTLFNLYGFEDSSLFLKNIFWSEAVAVYFIKFFAIISLSLSLWGIVNLIKSNNRSLAVFLFINIFIVPAFTFIVSLYGPNIFLDRTLIPVLAAYFILLSIAVGYIKNRRVSYVLFCIFLIFIVSGLIGKIVYSKKEPWRDIASYLNENVGVRDTVLLLPNSLKLAIDLYLPTDTFGGKIVSLPYDYPAIGVSDYYPAGTPSVPGMREQDIDKIAIAVRNSDNIVLLTRAEWIFDPKGLALDYLLKNFQLHYEKEWDYIKLSVFKNNKAKPLLEAN